MIGQIGVRKGQDVLVRAAAMLINRVSEVTLLVHAPCAVEPHYVVVGARHSTKLESHQFEAGLHALSGELAGQFHFLGVRDDVGRLLNELTLLAHPAWRTLGRVLLEAAASALPVVATNVGGTAEIFPPGSNTAWLIPPDDPTALASAITGLLANETLRSEMGAAAPAA